MAAIVFPLNPAVNQQHIAGGRAYTFTGESWSTGSDSLVPNQFTQVINAAGNNFIFNSVIGTQLIVLDPTKSLWRGDIKLPPNATNGQRCAITCTKSIQILGVQDATGDPAGVVNHPGAVGVGGKLEYMFSTITNKWVCILAERGKAFMQPKAADLNTINGKPANFVFNDMPGAMVIQSTATGNASRLVNSIQNPAGGASGVGWTYVLCWEPIENMYGADAQSAPAIGITLLDNTTAASFFLSCALVPGTQNWQLNGQYWPNDTTPGAVFATRINKHEIRGLKLHITDVSWSAAFGTGDGFTWSNGIWSAFIPGNGITSVTHVGIGVRTNNDNAWFAVKQFGAFYEA